MRGASREIEEALSAPHDYWAETRRGLAGTDSLDGLLPEFRALPECPEAAPLVAAGGAASQALVQLLRQERAATHAFTQALFLLLYFDSLFVYRDLKALYAEASSEQRPYLDVACRKILLRCLEIPETTSAAQTREIVRNTRRGRLATTPLIADLAAQAFPPEHGPVAIRDIGVSDGVTTLDLAEAAVRRGVAVSITGTDLRLYLHYAERGGNEVVRESSGRLCQYLLDGQTYGAGPPCPASAQAFVEEVLTGSPSETITTLAPQVDHAVRTAQHALRFEEEDVFHPNADLAEADIIRIANLLVERTEAHRGYFHRADIVRAIASLGRVAKDGAYLYLDNFLRKVEHIGLWRKEGEAWVRRPVEAEVAADLEGVGEIAVEGSG